MGSEWGIYNGRKIVPMLKKEAKERGVPYEKLKEAFLKKIIKPANEKFEKELPKYQERLAKVMVATTKDNKIEIQIDDDLLIKNGKVSKIQTVGGNVR